MPGGQTPAWYVAEWGKLASAVTGRPDAPSRTDRVQAHTLLLEAERHRGQALFAEVIGRGGSLEAATLAAARDLVGVETFQSYPVSLIAVGT